MALLRFSPLLPFSTGIELTYLTKHRTLKPCTRSRKKKPNKGGHSKLLVKFYLVELLVSRCYRSFVPLQQIYCLLSRYLVLGSFPRASLFTPNKFPHLGQTANASPASAISSLSIPPIWKKGSRKVWITKASPFLKPVVRTFVAGPWKGDLLADIQNGSRTSLTFHLQFWNDLEAYPGVQISCLCKV